MLQIAAGRPVPGILYGITHDLEGNALIREPKLLKVGIGLPRGRALNVWIHNDGKWYFRAGNRVNGKMEFKTVAKFATRKEAETFYKENYSKADIVNYPRKLGYFNFTRPVLGDDGVEVFEPDWEAMEKHGPTPTELDIVFLDDNPFTGAYQMWSTSELRCKGDGVNASRVLSMAATPEEKELAAEAQKAGQKTFPILQGCWTQGCPYSKETVDRNGKPVASLCKAGGDLKFQLANNIRIGGTAYFHTTGRYSIANIFSTTERIKMLTNGRLAGIPVKLMLRPFKTRHNGQPATQYGVHLELHAESVKNLQRNLIEQAFNLQKTLGLSNTAASLPSGPAQRLIETALEPAAIEADEEIPLSAQAMNDEFYGGGEEDFDDAPPEDYDGPGPEFPSPAPHSAAAATQSKTEALSEKLQAQTRKRKAAATPPADPVEAAAPAAEAAPAPDPFEPVPEQPEDALPADHQDMF